MNISKRVLVLLLALSMLLLTACTAHTPAETDTDETNSQETTSDTENTPTDTQRTNYNIIFALASIPPVMSAIESINSGYPTYAIIERGKTYSGIDKLDNFTNVGFNPGDNLSEGFTNTEFDAMVAQVKELKEQDGEEYFHIYVQDGTALIGAAIAANAGLGTDDFHVYMCEDGTGAYDALNNTYIDGKSVTASKDEVYENYASEVAASKAIFEDIMSKQTNTNASTLVYCGIARAYALAALDNFTYYLQNESTIISILENTGSTKTKLLSAFGVDGYTQPTDYKLNLRYEKLADGVAKLNAEDKTDYLTLMYGDYYKDTYAALTRTERADSAAPSKKLVFIGSRHGGYPAFASDATHGIGGLGENQTVPESYDKLDEKYKNELLFASQADYDVFLAVLNNSDNYSSDIASDVKQAAMRECFNKYIDYIYTLKFTYSVYGKDYDIIMKGHPREVIGAHTEWGNKYATTSGYCYDKLLDNALLAFHSSDSIGKYIGMVPYGTAAENLAYLGADISIAGLPSSTYSGFDTSVDVLFIIKDTSQNISESDAQVSDRYTNGTLKFTDSNGQQATTVLYNIGNVYKTAEALVTNSNTKFMYQTSFSTWLIATHGNTATDIDSQGFAVTPANN